MKKKIISVLLSVSMCLTMVSAAGAASFDSGDTEAMAVMAVDEEPNFGVGTVEDDESSDQDFDIFSAGEEEISEEDYEDGGFGDIVIDETIDDNGFIADAAGEDIPAAEAGEKILVMADDWEKEGEYFKLRKSAAKMAQGIPAAEGVPVTEQAEDASMVGEENNLAAETVEMAETGEIPETEDDPAVPEIPEIEDDPETNNVPSAEVSSAYYTEADGIVRIATEYNGIVHDGYYLFDEDGHLVTGRKVQTGGTEFWFTDAANATIYKEFKGEEIAPWSSDLGKQIKNGWAWAGSTFRFYDEQGKYITVSQLDTIYKQTGKYTGYYKIKDDYYCLDQNGKPKTGEITLKVGSSSFKYYFQPAKSTDEISGKMYYKGWFVHKTTKGERWVYYNQGVTNPKDIGKALERGIIATRLNTGTMGNYTYLIDQNGYLVKSTMKKAANGKYYCTDSRGVVYKDKLVKYNGARYYFTADGTRAAWKNMWHVCEGAGKRYYYFGSTAGRVVEKKGWQKLTNTKGEFLGWLYFPASGNHYINKVTSTDYYFTSRGKLAGGIHEINGKKYLFAVSDENTHRGKMYKNTLIYYKNRWFYADANGVLLKNGWKKVDGNYYYFDNYRAVTKKFVKKNGVNGYLDANGKFTQGWVIVSNSNNRVRYIDPDGTDFVRNGSKWIDGLLYYFDKDGYRINDLTNIYSQPYYYKVDRVNGVMTVYNSAGTVPVKSIRVSVGLPGTPTPLGGPYTLTPYGRWQALMGPSWGQYGTHVDGAGQGGIFVHSIACSQANSYNLPASAYRMLGSPASHGCIRACVADAKWVYEHSSGGRLYVFDGKANSNEAMKGPLGRRALVPLRYPYNFDPTDPAV